MAGTKNLSDEVKRKRVADQLMNPDTQQFWSDTFLHEPFPDDPNAPIQDYVYPPGYTFPIPEGTLDTMPNQFEAIPGWDPDKRGMSPSYYSPRVPGTLDRPSITFPEDATLRT